LAKVVEATAVGAQLNWRVPEWLNAPARIQEDDEELEIRYAQEIRRLRKVKHAIRDRRMNMTTQEE